MGSFGFAAALTRNHSDPSKQTRTPAYWHGILACSCLSHHIADGEFDGQTEATADWSLQQPAERRMMHESGRWQLFPYECTDLKEWRDDEDKVALDVGVN